MKIVKRVLKVLGIILLAVVLLCAAVLVWLTVVEYRPEDVETMTVEPLGGEEKQIAPGDTDSDHNPQILSITLN